MIHWLDSCGSTNAEAMQRDLPHGHAVAALKQTAGRGRLGRTWEEGQGNLYLSVVWRRPVANGQLPLLTLGAGVVLAELTGHGLKWPNDLLAPDHRKLAGILAEADWKRGELQQVVVGIGVNLRSAPHERAGALVDYQEPPPLRPFAEQVRETFARLDLSTVLDRWRARNLTLGKRVRIGAVEGTAVDLASDGALIVRDDQGHSHTVITGDLGFPSG